MWLGLILPELEAFTCWNPARGHTNIYNDKLNRTRPEKLSDILVCE